MNLFYIDVNKIIPDIIDAYSLVYGEEYKNMISHKIKNSIIIQYYDIEGYEEYISYIKRCKRKELAVTFLHHIGIDTNEYQEGLYSKPLSEETKNILENFLGSEYTCFDTYLDNYFSPICAFDTNNSIDKEKLLDNKIKLLNFFRKDKKKITRDTFDSFSKTNEYQVILKRIYFCFYMYKYMFRQYQDFESKLKPLEEFINSEKESFENEFYSNKIELFNTIFPTIQNNVKLLLKTKCIEEQYDTLIGLRDLSYKTPIEYFSEEDMNKLKDESVSLDEKYWIVFFQTNYLKNLGVKFNEDYILSIENSKFINDYLDFISKEDIQKLIPSKEIIDLTQKTREENYQNALYNYYTNRSDFTDNYSRFYDNPQNKNFLYQQIVSNDVCVIDGGGRNSKNIFFSIMFFTFKKNYGGKIDHCFIHELGHIIDQNENGCGFEASTYGCNTGDKNPYVDSVRKYEKFNETINDIYTIKVLDILRSKDIHLIENKFISCYDTSSFNTSIYLKNLLIPLIEKYGDYVSKAKIYANPNYLIEAIGLKNYEDLVNIVNKVYYLLDNGLFCSDNHSESLEKEYCEQLEILERTYQNIDEFHNSIKHILCI